MTPLGVTNARLVLCCVRHACIEGPVRGGCARRRHAHWALGFGGVAGGGAPAGRAPAAAGCGGRAVPLA